MNYIILSFTDSGKIAGKIAPDRADVRKAKDSVMGIPEARQYDTHSLCDIIDRELFS